VVGKKRPLQSPSGKALEKGGKKRILRPGHKAVSPWQKEEGFTKRQSTGDLDHNNVKERREKGRCKWVGANNGKKQLGDEEETVREGVIETES